MDDIFPSIAEFDAMTLIDLFCKKMPMPCLLRGLLERCFSAGRLDDLFEAAYQAG